MGLCLCLLPPARAGQIIVEQADGSFVYHSGAVDWNEIDTTSDVSSGVSFFLPPYCSVVTLQWTIGYDVEAANTVTGAQNKRSLQKIDHRVQQLFFQCGPRARPHMPKLVGG